MSTTEIRNYKKVNEKIITGGQPNEAQIKSSADEGFQAIINLATIDPRYSLEDEGGLARSLGMDYYHIPVEWENPTGNDFDTFTQTMRQVSDKKVLIHCAANYRVTAFYSLYAMKNLGWSEEKANEFMASIWKDGNYPVWKEFIRKIKARILSRD